VTAQGRGRTPLLSGSAVFQHLSFTIGDYRLKNEGDAVVTMEAGKLLAKTLNFTGPGSRMAVTGSLDHEDFDSRSPGMRTFPAGCSSAKSNIVTAMRT
jgi:hypothetical protein